MWVYTIDLQKKNYYFIILFVLFPLLLWVVGYCTSEELTNSSDGFFQAFLREEEKSNQVHTHA